MAIYLSDDEIEEFKEGCKGIDGEPEHYGSFVSCRKQLSDGREMHIRAEQVFESRIDGWVQVSESGQKIHEVVLDNVDDIGGGYNVVRMNSKTDSLMVFKDLIDLYDGEDRKVMISLEE